MFKYIAVGIVCLAGQADATKLHVSNQAKLELEAQAAIKALNKVESRIKLMGENGELEEGNFDWNKITGRIGNAFNNVKSRLDSLFH